MGNVKLSIEVEPEFRRRIKLAATVRDETVKELIERAIRRELEALGDVEVPYVRRDQPALDEAS